jgi:hypothetical protein
LNDNAPATQRRRRIRAIRSVHLVVVNQAAVAVPDSDPEFVRSPAAWQISVNGSKDETAIAFDRLILAGLECDLACTLVLRQRACYDQPLIVIAGEFEVCLGLVLFNAETELSIAGRDTYSATSSTAT